jgi:hypothetical protein
MRVAGGARAAPRLITALREMRIAGRVTAHIRLIPCHNGRAAMVGMKMLLLVFAVFVLAQPVWAEPPADAMPLSEILRMLEDRGEIAYFEEIEWDDDGYWEIEYVTREGEKVEIRVDPVSGEPRGR